MVSFEQWRAAMVAKGIPKMEASRGFRPSRASQLRYAWRRLRYRLGCWVAGQDLD